MKSFKEQLGVSNEEVKNIRVSNFTKMLSTESKTWAENRKISFMKKQMQLEQLLDLSPTNSFDLSSKLSEIKTEELIKNVYTIAGEIIEEAKKAEARIAIHNRLFPDDKIEPLTEEELDFIKDIRLI